jgi:hypothetical protein
MTSTEPLLDIARRRRVIAASCAAAPAALLAAFLTGPSMAYANAASSLTDVAHHRTACIAQAALMLLSSALFVPVLVGALHLLRGRGRTVGSIGAVAFLAGICGHLMLVAARLVLVQMTTHDADHATMLALAKRLSGGVFGIITPLEFCFDAGLVLIFIALYRAAVISTWILAVIIGVAIAAGVLGSTKVAFIAAGTGGLIAGAYVAHLIATSDDDAWSRGTVSRTRRPAVVERQLASAN